MKTIRADSIPETDWITHNFAVRIEDVEYSVLVNVYTERSKRGTSVNCEGYSMLPEINENHPHWKKLEAAVMEEIETEFQDL